MPFPKLHISQQASTLLVKVTHDWGEARMMGVFRSTCTLQLNIWRSQKDRCWLPIEEGHINVDCSVRNCSNAQVLHHVG